MPPKNNTPTKNKRAASSKSVWTIERKRNWPDELNRCSSDPVHYHDNSIAHVDFTGMDVSRLCDDFGFTPIHYAARYGFFKLLQDLFFRYKATNPNPCAIYKCTPFDISLESDDDLQSAGFLLYRMILQGPTFPSKMFLRYVKKFESLKKKNPTAIAITSRIYCEPIWQVESAAKTGDQEKIKIILGIKGAISAEQRETTKTTKKQIL